MDGLEGKIAEEGLAVAEIGVNPADHPVGVKLARVKVGGKLGFLEPLEEIDLGIGGSVRLLLVVIGTALGKNEGVLEALRSRQALLRVTEVPLPSHVGVIAGIVQHGGDGGRTAVQPAFVARLATLIVRQQFGHVAESHNVVVHAGH